MSKSVVNASAANTESRQGNKPVNNSGKWQFWIDRGGTFTDIVAQLPDGGLTSCKLLSENPDHYSDAAIAGIRQLLNINADQPLPVDQISAVKMGTTVATNALLERQGEDTLLLITQGFADALRIGYQNRPDLFALDIDLPEMLYKRVIEVQERLDVQGNVLQPLNPGKVKKDLQAAYESGLRSVAIVLMHGYRYPHHEQQLARLAEETGFTQISLSHRCSSLIKLVSRGDATVVDAYLTPVLKRYIKQVSAALSGLQQAGGRLEFMRSNGGLTDATLFQGKDAILSGPAGGIVGMVRTARRAGFDRIIGFDMGGTSTDVSHYNHQRGGFEYTLETEVAGVRMRAPMLEIHTVAAGGGSICRFDGARYRVGPESAGASPGPASYGNGGPLTITDCNVMLGKLQSAHFPAVFGEQGDQPLDCRQVEHGFSQLAAEVSANTAEQTCAEEVASGFLAIAVQNMANAIKKISVQRGHDASDYVLCCFGGAGGQHACLVAEALCMKQVFIHPYAGVLSAYGMGLADTVATRQQAIEAELDSETLASLQSLAESLRTECEKELVEQNLSDASMRARRRLQIRYQGSDSSLSCDFEQPDMQQIKQRFEAQHQQRFGFITPEKHLIVESLQVDVRALADAPPGQTPVTNRSPAMPLARHRVYMQEKWRDCPFYQRDSLVAGQAIPGPAIILESAATTVVEPSWEAHMRASGDLLLTHRQDAESHQEQNKQDLRADPVRLEIFNNLFMSIAEQMGYVLANTAVSVNIKERLDFSCAIFNQEGDLVANAPHMPVHLGSMSESIKAVIRNVRDMAVGDAIVLNAPYNGGTHLPDITVVKPVFDAVGHQILFYVASRGHHADIGGKTPGSAPADSSHIDEEGVVIHPVRLVRRGVFQEQSIRALLSSGAYPVRNIEMNIADLKAQLAACEKGAQELISLVAHYSLDVVQAYMSHVQDNAEASVRRLLTRLEDGAFCQEMDGGQKICVAIRVDKAQRRAVVDFTGSSSQHPGNYNAPLAIAKAAVLYVFRCLVNDDIPLNQGCLKPLDIIVPSGSILNPEYPAAVIAGNVETSQTIVDALFGALKVMAASQGTMNNVFWGNREYQYYETLCGGAGATPKKDGASAVHSHMTNSRLTDPEVLEQRFPVILESFKIRKGSGGAGRHHGGDGVIRKTRFLESMTVTLLTGHRQIPPYGMAGGKPGKTGQNLLQRKDGKMVVLGTTAEVAVEPGDVLIIKTPGGGGYGD